MIILFNLDIDDCDPDPCLNGGTCVDLIDGYNCKCTPGYYGENCVCKELIALLNNFTQINYQIL